MKKSFQSLARRTNAGEDEDVFLGVGIPLVPAPLSFCHRIILAPLNLKAFSVSFLRGSTPNQKSQPFRKVSQWFRCDVSHKKSPADQQGFFVESGKGGSQKAAATFGLSGVEAWIVDYRI
jgi:hypothetical protein